MKERVSETLRILRSVVGTLCRGVVAGPVQIASLWASGAMRSPRIIVFLVPGLEQIDGGILSIFNLYRFSIELSNEHHAKVLMCYYPGQWRGKWRYRSVDGAITIYPYALVTLLCRRAESMLVHIPNIAVPYFLEMGGRRLAQLRRKHGLRINILNQNILHMPADIAIHRLREAVPELSCTTAHPSYTTAEYRRRWGVPVHHLPAFTYPHEPVVSSYETKRNLLIVSPDPSPHRDAVLGKISSELPHLQIQVISGMRFEEYLKLAQVAKWSLTFGEGLDDYFIGVSLRGGVGFAVYNQDFFTPEFKDLPTVYPDWDSLADNIVGDIKAMDNEQAMAAYTAQVLPLLTQTWSSAKTRLALKEFYQGRFTLP